METVSRRNVVRGAAWAVPVLAAVAAAPVAAASTPVASCEGVPISDRYVVKVVYLGNHGHGGATGNGWFDVWFDCSPDPVRMTNPEVMTSGNARLIELAKAARKEKKK